MKYELLAPVGNFAMLHAAIDAGADAVYLGLKEFSMRANARNFTIKDLPKIRKVCDNSTKRVSVYLTINTIIYDNELRKIESTIRKVKDNVDAIICWDLSVIKLCKKYGIPFHISTQASIANEESAKFYQKLGAERIVLARELNLKQIKKISKIKGIETECFIHGAMCVAISGRCFTSQFIHGISANRGLCAQPCRRSWTITDGDNNKLKLKNNKVMSAKDLCTLPFIEKMKRAGITSFKIEGRNRSPEYVHKIVSVYRKALDKRLSRKQIIEGIKELKTVYNRGLSSGFYLKMPTSDDFSFSENGEQKEYKQLVGKVEKYWPRVAAASVKMLAGKLATGDEVYLISEDSAIKRIEIKSIEKKGKKVSSTKKGEEIGITLPKCKRGTEIYLIKKR
jgi:U32 family peptidase